jgi:hypothetical protein
LSFWDAAIADLGVAHIHVSDPERHILHNGGTVMALVVLPDPSVHYGGDYGMTDTSGQEVLVPLLVRVIDVDALYTATWKHQDPVTMVEHMDFVWGSTWRDHPTYIGLLDERDTDRYGQHFYYRGEEPHPYRVWSCYPISNADDYAAYVRLCDYTDARLEAADWYAVDSLLHAQNSEEMDLEDACVKRGLVSPPKDWTSSWPSEYEDDLDQWDDDWVSFLLTTYASFCDARKYFCWSWDKPDDKDITFFEVPPIEDYFNPDDVEAYAIWNGIYVRRQIALDRVGRVLHPNERFRFNEREIA